MLLDTKFDHWYTTDDFLSMHKLAVILAVDGLFCRQAAVDLSADGNAGTMKRSTVWGHPQLGAAACWRGSIFRASPCLKRKIRLSELANQVFNDW
jgi:hypothetical protein